MLDVCFSGGGMTAPDGLDTAGVALWDAVLEDLPEGWELDSRELSVLELAARQADVVAALEAVVTEEGEMTTGSTGQPAVHPAIPEARQGRLAIDRLLGKIVMPAPESGSEGATGATTKAQRAADARWREQAIREARGGTA